RRVIAELVEDLVHLERSEDRFDEHGRADRAVRNSDELLRADEDVVPEPRFEMRLHLRQIEIWTGAAHEQLFRVVKKVEREIEDRSADWFSIDEEMLLDEMPSARTYEQRRRLFVERVLLRAAGKCDRATHGVVKIDVTFEAVRPRRRVRVFEVG